MHSRRYAPWLLALLIIFVGRVVAQYSLTIFELPFLPPFEAWYSGAIPYKQLLIWQILIIFVMGLIVWRFGRAQVVPRRRVGITCLILGALYLIVMVIRLLVGFADLSDAVWFHRPIPSFFHLILATFVLLVGHFNFTQAQWREEPK